jgi:hypothetical protein
MATNYIELVPKPDPGAVNIGLNSLRVATARALLGEPRESYTIECQKITNAALKARIRTESVGPFRATGVDVALAHMREILTDVRTELPDLYAILRSAGMECARKVRLRQPDGTIKAGKNPSNHSWGLAIDIKLDKSLDKQGDNKCLRGLLMLSRYFNAHGWYWGVSFPTEDAMHFEVSEQLLKRWRSEGKI